MIRYFIKKVNPLLYNNSIIIESGVEKLYIPLFFEEGLGLSSVALLCPP